MSGTRNGVLFGLAAYLLWGLLPVYIKAVAHVAPLEVLAHRILGSAVLTAALVVGLGQYQAWRKALGAPAVRSILVGSSLLLATNWLVYIHAVASGQILQASLGYFLTPLVQVSLGYLFLGERLRRPQQVSLVLAAVGVLYLGIHYGRAPWIALVLACTFSCYSLIRKTVRAGSLVGLSLETALLGPAALAFILYLALGDRGQFLSGAPGTDGLLLLAGVVTTVPLLFFAGAARRLRLATIGFLQFTAPSLQFLLAVAVYGEAFTRTHAICFACIWSGLILYAWDAARSGRRGLDVR